MPLILATALPLGPLLFFVATTLQLGFWALWVALMIVYPTLLMGIVERHIRSKLRGR